MAALAENLLLLNQIRIDIKAAIEAKGVVVAEAPFSDYPALISSIFGGGVSPAPEGFWLGETVTWSGEEVTWGAP